MPLRPAPHQRHAPRAPRAGFAGALRRMALWAVLALSATTATAWAEARHAAMIVDANTGAVIYNQSGDEPRHPASLTKMMTLYMVFEQIELGRLNYQTRIKVTPEAAAVAPSKLDLEAGDDIALLDAIKALVTKSANDMAVAIAMHIGGTEANFARLMTAKARALGMSATTFRNASGLPDPEQFTTARDMITLGLHLQDDFPQHYPLFGLTVFTYQGASHRNHNTLLFTYRGTDGIKTGYTRGSGFNLVANVRRDGKHLLGAIFGGETAATRNARLRALLDRALPVASLNRTRKPTSFAVAARGAPVPRRQPAPRTAPAPSATAATTPPPPMPPTPRLAARPPQPQPAPAAEPAPSAGQSAAAAPEAAPGAWQMAKVRSVAVVPNSPRQPAAPTPLIEPAAATTPPPRSVEPGPRPNAAGRAPSTLAEQATALTSPTNSRQPPTALASAEPAMPPSYHLRGPAYGDAAPATPPAQPATALRAPAGQAGGYQIQIGAYASAAEAERQLAKVSQNNGSLLAGREPRALPVSKGDRQLYRARFSGFDQATAATACQALQRQHIECMVTRAE